MNIHGVTEEQLNAWARTAIGPSEKAAIEMARLGIRAGKPMTEAASELLSAIRDATDDGRIEWILDDDGKKLHTVLPGSVSDYAAVMRRNDKYTMEIHDAFGKVIDKIEPSIMQDRSTISYIHSYAMDATSQSKAIFDEIIECLTNK